MSIDRDFIQIFRCVATENISPYINEDRGNYSSLYHVYKLVISLPSR